MRKRTVTLVVVIAGAAVVGVGAGVVGITLEQKADASESTGERSDQRPGEILEYWTEERMERATPR